MIIRTKEHGDVDLDTATRETLVLVRAGLETDLQEINFSIKDADQTYRDTGKRYAPDWMRRVQLARKAVLKRLTYVNVAISAIPKESKPPSKKGQRVADLFVDIAKVRLQEAVFADILKEAVDQWEQAR
jgi:hypothetical protein